MPAVEARGVWKTFDETRYVLEDVSLDVDPGEVVVLMGRSGSGKTTLLNLVAGLDIPTRGRLRVGDAEIGPMDEDARTRHRLENVGIVFQRFHLIPELTVEENVRLPMTFARRPDAKKRCEGLLEMFGITDRGDAFPATLSGGETQRAAIARALANEPTVILADEPTANLDDANARVALQALRAVARETGTAVLVATHDPMARDAADRVHHIVDGRLYDAAPVTRAPDQAGGPGTIQGQDWPA